jgi:RimJ/RimL family protein N-acetyltransferase
MSYTIHPIAKLTPSLVEELAALHLQDHGLLSQLGYPFVLRYYQLALKDKRMIGIFAQDDETGKLIGYNVASPTPAFHTAQLTSDKAWFLKEIVKVFFTRPSVFFQLLISSLTIKEQMKNEADAVESLYLTVDENQRGKKIGWNLQIALFEEAKKAGYKRIVGSIETWNIASIKVCESNGFVIKKTIREGKFLRHRIEKIL